MSYKVKKIQAGTYRVTFRGKRLVIAVPNMYLELGFSEKQLEDIAIETAKEQL